jgi:hypothetical protein
MHIRDLSAGAPDDAGQDDERAAHKAARSRRAVRQLMPAGAGAAV